jgi:hypothetical protein
LAVWSSLNAREGTWWIDPHAACPPDNAPPPFIIVWRSQSTDPSSATIPPIPKFRDGTEHVGAARRDLPSRRATATTDLDISAVRCNDRTHATLERGKQKKRKRRSFAHTRSPATGLPLPPSCHRFGNAGTQGTMGTKTKLGIWIIQYIAKWRIRVFYVTYKNKNVHHFINLLVEISSQIHCYFLLGSELVLNVVCCYMIPSLVIVEYELEDSTH